MKRISLVYAALVVLGVTAGVARAADLAESRFVVRGFGTLAATTVESDGREFRRNVGQSRAVGDGDVELATDSLAGLQLDVHLGSGFDAMTQAVMRQTVEGDWTPQLTQAFVRYSPDDSLVLRVGRVGFDICLLAESRQVGYSYLTVRPSADFYGLVTNDEVDGGDIAITRRIGRGLVRARVFGGTGSDATVFPDGSIWKGDSRVYGGTLDYLYRGFTARAAWLQVTYDAQADLIQLADILTSTGVPESIAIGNDLRGSQPSHALQLGVAYDDGPLQAQVLYGHIISESISGPNVNAWYAQVGYRFGAWTPFVALADSRDRDPIRSTGLPDIPELAPINETVFGIQKGLRASQHTATVGARWDLSPRIALKAQADFTSVRDSVLSFDRRAPGGGPSDMTVITIAMDFVF